MPRALRSARLSRARAMSASTEQLRPESADAREPLGASVALLLASAASGVAALAWQALWMRRLGETFGGTALSIAFVLAIFFAGLGIGARLLAPLADRLEGAAWLFAALELGIAACGLGFPALCGAAEHALPAVDAASPDVLASLTWRALLAALLLLPPSLLMGATLPCLIRHVARTRVRGDRGFAALYGANTLGACAGTLAAWFWALPSFGFAGCAAIGAAGNALAAALAWIAGRCALPALEHEAAGEPAGTPTSAPERAAEHPAASAHTQAATHTRTSAHTRAAAHKSTPARTPASPRTPAAAVPTRTSSPARRTAPAPVVENARAATASDGQPSFLLAAAASGFLSIALELAATRGLASKLSSTSFSYATISAVYLLALGSGSLAAHAWLRAHAARAAYAGWTWIGGALAALSALYALALGPNARGASFWSAQRAEFGSALSVLGFGGLCFGASLPLLVALAPGARERSGRALGSYYFANSLGAAAGALATGLWSLPNLGLRGSIVACAAGSLALAAWIGGRERAWNGRQGAALLGAFALAAALWIGAPRDLRLWADRPGQQLRAQREGLLATVSVVEDEGDLLLKLNGSYRLGGARSKFAQQRQGLIPLLLHPAPEHVLFLGVGTGSSAGAAAALGEARIDLVELIPELRELLPAFRDINEELDARLARDPRLRWLPVDGRNWVRATPASYDVIIGDLYVPWQSGECGMYTREHFESVRAALRPGGLFCQWLPLYQLSTDDLRTIAATFASVFPEPGAVWLYFNAEQASLGLLGSESALPDTRVRWRAWARDARRGPLLAGAGLAEPAALLGSELERGAWTRGLIEGVEIERRARPRIEFSAPVARTRAGDELSRRNIELLLASDAAARARRGALAASAPAEELAVAGYRDAIAAFFRAELALRERGDRGEALRQLGLAFAAVPGWEWIAWNVDQLAAQALEARDLVALEEAARLLSNEARYRLSGLWWRARLCAARGENEQARAALEEILAIDPQHAPSRELLQQLGR